MAIGALNLFHFQQFLADDQVSVKLLRQPSPGPISPLRPDLVDAARQLTDKFWPGVPVVPIMVMGATDGAYLRRAGIPCYGIQGFFMDRDDIRFHGRDERMRVQSFYITNLQNVFRLQRFFHGVYAATAVS
jgi:acetylornithine deacetylase/succinyl-diaminopimelate desuccinylase-like protein